MTSALTRDITHKTPNVLVEIKIDKYCRTKIHQNMCGVLRASNIVMSASNDVLEVSNVNNANIQ